MELYDQLKATGDQDEQIELMKEILEITAEQFYTIGTVTWREPATPLGCRFSLRLGLVTAGDLHVRSGS